MSTTISAILSWLSEKLETELQLCKRGNEGLKGEALVDHYFRDLILAIREVKKRITA